MSSREALLELCRVNPRAGLAVLDRDLRYVFVTRSWAQPYGLGERELIGQRHFDVFRELSEAERAGYLRCLDGGVERRERQRVARPDGGVAWISWDARPWRTETGAIGGVAIFSEPVTDAVLRDEAVAELARLRAAEAARGRELDALRRAALAIAALDAGLARRDPEVLQLVLDQARILAAADYGALGVGTDPERELDPWLWAGLRPEQAAAIGARPRPVGLLGRIARGETLRLDDVGAAGPVQLPPHHPALGPLLGVPLGRREDPIGNLYLARRPGAAPFTHDEQVFVELIADQATTAVDVARLRAELRQRDVAVAIVAHDLKGPLNSIALREQLLVREHGELVTAHARAVAQVVDAMRRMTRSLVDVASADAGELRLDVQPVDVAALVQEVVDTEQVMAAVREVALEVRAGQAGTFPLDRDRIWRVLANLIENAVKYTPPGGRVEIRAERSADELVLAVADTGPGIDPAAIAHVFDRYYSAPSRARGAGLGLYIVKTIVEAHGGRVRADSEPGRGTVFVVSLPLPRA